MTLGRQKINLHDSVPAAKVLVAVIKGYNTAPKIRDLTKIRHQNAYSFLKHFCSEKFLIPEKVNGKTTIYKVNELKLKDFFQKQANNELEDKINFVNKDLFFGEKNIKSKFSKIYEKTFNLFIENEFLKIQKGIQTKLTLNTLFMEYVHFIQNLHFESTIQKEFPREVQIFLEDLPVVTMANVYPEVSTKFKKMVEDKEFS